MSDLDGRQRDASVPKSENMIQYAFKQYNNTKDTMESIKSTPKIYREVNQARANYKQAKEVRQAQNEQTPVVSAQDIKDEMYR
ncbi:MAG: hypothetical protein HFJ30_06545 [Clostridia bacterium]|jgi:hypothetical protein|nr:hypothetical protein [Clostridia bacterium]MCI9413131.1 hypothetical protein [Clostridia bacterium]